MEIVSDESKTSKPTDERPVISRRKFLQIAGVSLATAPLTFPLSAVAGKAKQIPTRPIPSSGEPLPVLGLGQSSAFRSGDLELSTELLNILTGMGGRFVDTGGTAQRIMGQYMRTHNAHDKLFLGTNVFPSKENEMLSEIQLARKVQGKVALDLVQARSLEDLNRQWENLLEWKAAGLTRHVGFAMSRRSYYEPVMALMETGTMDFVQVNYSVLEPEAANDVLPLARDKGVAVVTNRPFVNGKYFPLVSGHPLPEWAQEFDCHSWAQFSLKFILGHPAINCVLTETSKAKHAVENLSAGFGRLPDEPTRQRMVKLVRSFV
jgi:diketogulonate reductase-like aldo/keto reductase